MLTELARHAAAAYERVVFAGLRQEVADLRGRLRALQQQASA